MELFILVACAVAMIGAIGFLLLAGKHAQRGIVWTARMGKDD